VKELRETGAGAMFQTMSLPEGMAITSSDVIASLNEHLVQALQELSLKEGLLEKMETTLAGCQRKIAVMRHQKGLVYKEHYDLKKSLEDSQNKLEEELKNVKGLREDDQVRLQEFNVRFRLMWLSACVNALFLQRLIDTLNQDEPEIRRRLADLTRKITVLRVNEKALTRRYSAMQDIESGLRRVSFNEKLMHFIERERSIRKMLRSKLI
jgi:centrosomal protein CEP290